MDFDCEFVTGSRTTVPIALVALPELQSLAHFEPLLDLVDLRLHHGLELAENAGGPPDSHAASINDLKSIHIAQASACGLPHDKNAVFVEAQAAPTQHVDPLLVVPTLK